MKRFACTSLRPKTLLYVYALTAHDAAVKAGRAGYLIGEVTTAGEYEPVRNVIVEAVVHLNGKANGHVNGHANGGQR